MENYKERNGLKVLFDEGQIKKRVNELGKEISRDYKDCSGLEVICVLKGAFVFMSDLLRSIDIPASVNFIRASSYVRTKSSGKVKISGLSDVSLRGKDVLIVEDIADTGLTLLKIKQKIIKKFKVKSVKTAVFLDKEERRKADFKADYRCFKIPDKFVVGYGLDYDEKYRELPFLAEYKE